MPHCSCFSVSDGCFQSVPLPVVEFDSAAAALRIFHTKVLERKSLVNPVQCTHPSFPPDSAAAYQPARLASIASPSLPLAPTGIGPVRPQCAVARQESGKDTHAYPTHAELYRRMPPHHSHCYKAEAELPYAILFLIKLNWLDEEDLGVLSMIHPDFEAMATSIPRLLQVDFTSLRDPSLTMPPIP
jgi:hypothetical protein